MIFWFFTAGDGSRGREREEKERKRNRHRHRHRTTQDNITSHHNTTHTHTHDSTQHSDITQLDVFIIKICSYNTQLAVLRMNYETILSGMVIEKEGWENIASYASCITCAKKARACPRVTCPSFHVEENAQRRSNTKSFWLHFGYCGARFSNWDNGCLVVL